MPRRAVLVDAYPHIYAGAQRVDHLLARGLPEHGWNLTIVTTGTGVFTERLVADGIEPVIVDPTSVLSVYGRQTTGTRALRAAAAAPRFWWQLGRVIRGLGAEVVHAVGQRGLILAGPAARACRVPLIWHVQGLSTSRVLNLAGSALASAVVAPTLAAADRMPFLDRLSPITAIPSVTTGNRPTDDEPTASRRDPPIVVCMARLHPDKGLDVLIDALPRVLEHHPAVSVRIIGGPQDGYEELEAQLTGRATDLGVAHAIDFVGYVDDPVGHLREASIYVQPSRERTELLPLAILDAMAAGLPVVASDVGGVRDLVDAATGRLVPADDTERLAGALIDLLSHPDELAQLGAGARSLAAEPRFTPSGLCASFAALYDELAQ